MGISIRMLFYFVFVKSVIFTKYGALINHCSSFVQKPTINIFRFSNPTKVIIYIMYHVPNVENSRLIPFQIMQ